MNLLTIKGFKEVNKKRVKIEHIFANINMIFKAICQIKMLEKQS